MSTPLPPELLEVERLLESTRAGLPEGVRARVLATTRDVPARLTTGWFAVAAAVAASVLLNLFSSAALLSSEPSGELDPCALSRALHEPPEACLGLQEKR
jgi:hypothetical protein